MDIANGDDVRAVLLVEIVEVRLVLEEVCVDLAGLNNIVGLDIIFELFDVKGDALSGKDLLGNGEDLGVRCGGCSDGYGLTLECVVVDGGIVAVTGVRNTDGKGGGDAVGDGQAQAENGAEGLASAG